MKENYEYFYSKKETTFFLSHCSVFSPYENIREICPFSHTVVKKKQKKSVYFSLPVWHFKSSVFLNEGALSNVSADDV